MNNYQQIVQENVRHMGIDITKFRACAYEIVDGQPRVKIPAGYTTPDTLFKNTGIGTTCELCGHDIKYCYYIADDENRLILMVGSECVTHFEQSAGEEIKRDFMYEYIRECYQAYRALWGDLYRAVYPTCTDRYGRAYRGVKWDVLPLFMPIKKLSKIDTNNKASLTRWYNKQHRKLEHIFLQAYREGVI